MKKIFIFVLCIFLSPFIVSADSEETVAPVIISVHDSAVTDDFKKYADPKIDSFLQKVAEIFPDVEKRISKLEKMNENLLLRIEEIGTELRSDGRFTPCCQLQNQLAKFKYIRSSIEKYQIKEYLNEISISGIPNDWKTVSLPVSAYKSANLKFAIPEDLKHQDSIGVGGKGGDDFYNSEKTKRLFVTQYFIGKCAEVFSYCTEEEYTDRTGKEDFNLFINYLKEKGTYDYVDEYNLVSLGEKAMVSKNQRRYLFENDGNIYSFSFTFENDIIDTDFIDQVLTSIEIVEEDSIVLKENENETDINHEEGKAYYEDEKIFFMKNGKKILIEDYKGRNGIRFEENSISYKSNFIIYKSIGPGIFSVNIYDKEKEKNVHKVATPSIYGFSGDSSIFYSCEESDYGPGYAGIYSTLDFEEIKSYIVTNDNIIVNCNFNTDNNLLSFNYGDELIQLNINNF